MKNLIKDENANLSDISRLIYASLTLIMSIGLIVLLFNIGIPFLNYLSEYVLSTGVASLQIEEKNTNFRNWGFIIFVIVAIVVFFLNIHKKEQRDQEYR